MELQKFINDNENYIDEFKKKGLVVKRFSKENLILVKYKFNENLEEEWFKYCRGCIIDIKTNKLILVPPMKSEELSEDIIENTIKDINYNISYLLDGTMINIFFHNNEWLMSTRSDIGCLNKWNNKLNFKNMFLKTINNDNFYNELDINNTYSFLLQHKLNRNVSQINDNYVYIIEVKNKESLESLEIPKLTNILNMESLNLVINNIYDIQSLFSSFSYNLKGLNINLTNKRYKLLNPQFIYVRDICVNTTDLMKKFIYLKKTNNVNNYLNYYSEYKNNFENYNTKFNIMINELYDNYCKLYISKNIIIKDIPFQLKPLMFEIHNIYKTYNKKINKKIIEKYIITLDLNRILFIINYYK